MDGSNNNNTLPFIRAEVYNIYNMETMKVLRVIGYIVIILALPVLLLSSSLAWGFNSHWLYNYGFEKYGVSESTGLPAAELNKAADALINYFNSSDEYIAVTVTADGRTFELFTQEEKVHFKDVKQLIKLDYKVLYISLAIVVVLAFLLVVGDFRNNWRGLAKTLVWGSILSVVLIIVIALASFFNFDNLFLQFHYLAFTNEFWSANGYMLMLFPGDFWYNAAFICIAFMAGLALIVGGLSFLSLKLEDRWQFKTH
jgi:integral membrane protein (TIGR01906 family)